MYSCLIECKSVIRRQAQLALRRVVSTIWRTTGKAAEGKGAKARMATLAPKERKALASKAAKTRWAQGQEEKQKALMFGK